MSDPADATTDEFQQRLDALGLDAHWTEVGEQYGEYTDQGMPSDTALRAALDDYSSDDADIEELRLEFSREQHRLVEETFEVVVEIPEETKELIERRLKLFGESPEEAPDEFLDLALELMEIRFARELDDENDA
jgi:hypothetical protein